MLICLDTCSLTVGKLHTRRRIMKTLRKLLLKILTTFKRLLTKNLPLGICSVSLLSGCVTSPPDLTACANEITRGYCRTFMTHKTIIIDNDKNPYISPQTGKKYLWRELVQIAVIFPPNEWAVAKSWWDNYCHQTNNCTAGIGDWQSVVNDLGSHVGVK